jgi:multidrug efflux pump subunit AcrB
MNRLVLFSLKNRPFTFVVFLMLLALGVQAWRTIPRAEDPVIPIPGFSIIVVMPGASPTDMERLVVDPIEESLSELDDIETFASGMDQGVADIGIEFVAGSDADKKYEEVLRQVNAVRSRLPDEVLALNVVRYTATNVAILQFAVVSETASVAELRAATELLEDRIEAVPGVKGVEVFGIPKRQVEVALQPERLQATGLPVDAALGAIIASNKAIPAGSLDIDRRRFPARTEGELTSVQDLRDVVVAPGASGVVRLSDLAAVYESSAVPTHLTRFNGQRAAFVTVMQKDRQNIETTKTSVLEVIEGLRGQLPDGMSVAVGFDQERNVAHRLAGFERDFAIAVGLVLLTLLPLGLRAASIVMLSIPLSLAVGLFTLHVLGFSLNQLSIVGFVIALGLLVDDSIVVVENIARHLRQGYAPLQAARAATTQIALAVLGCTATLVLAFVPLLFMPGTSGAFIRSLPATVVATVGASFIVSLTIIPTLASMWMKPDATHGNWFLRTLERVLHVSYRPILARSIRHPWITLTVAAALFAGSLALVPHIGFSLFPKAGIPQVRVTVEMENGATLEQTDAVIRHIDEDLRSRPEVASTLANVGRDNPMMYYNSIPRQTQSKVGDILVNLDTFERGRDAAFLDSLRDAYRAIPGARVEVREFEQGPPIEAPIAIRLIGADLADLSAAAASVEESMRSTEGTEYVSNPLAEQGTELVFSVDRAQATRFGVAPVDVSRALRLAVSGLGVGTLRDEAGDEHEILVTLASTRGPDRLAAPDLSVLDQSFVPSRSGSPVPLRALVTSRLEGAPSTVRHYFKERSVTVTSYVKTGYNTGKVTSAVVDRIEKDPPRGVRMMVAGEVESRNKSLGGAGVAAIVAFFGILAVLILEFNGLRGTLIVLSVVPLGALGGLFALWLTNNSLSFVATIGFIALMGIEVKNSILLVDFTNQLREQGVPLDEAIAEAGETRFVPVLLTTLTALGGLVPLALEHSPLTSPLAIVLIGGLITSTMLTRIVTPVVYKLLAPPLAKDDELETGIEPAPVTA